jgi:tRNA A-37 threonylcarbamoyl transferase component Bud32
MNIIRHNLPTIFSIKYFDLTLIYKTRNEIYRGVHKYIPINPRILKYTNDDSREVEIMNYLRDKIYNVPTVYHHNIGENISPSNKSFNSLVVMSEIKGKVIDAIPVNGINRGLVQSFDNYITRDQLSLINRRKIIINLINLIDKLHSYNVIYGDGFLTNIIVSDESKVNLIDFGNSFFKNNTPDYASTNKEYPIESDDILYLLKFMGYLLDIPFPKGYNWKLMKAIDLLKLIE